MFQQAEAMAKELGERISEYFPENPVCKGSRLLLELTTPPGLQRLRNSRDWRMQSIASISISR